MKKYFFALTIVCFALNVFQVSVAKDDFYGVIESRPDGKIGTWSIGGRSIEVTENTHLDEDNGPLKPGVCVEVDIDNGKVDEIESEPAEKCSQ